MNAREFEQWARGIAADQNFIVNHHLSTGTYYRKDHPRTMVFLGIYKNISAVLKVYDDPRITDEAFACRLFLECCTSDSVTAPEILAHQMLSSHKGWLITAAIAAPQSPFSSPLTREKRKEFLDLYLEYRTHTPSEPPRPLRLIEHLPAQEFHTFRLSRWFDLAQQAEIDRPDPYLDPGQLIPRFHRTLELIRQGFVGRKRIWCHGHFKPDSVIYNQKSGKYYLIDFAHAGVYPEGYELTFMLWADVLMEGDYGVQYEQWRELVDEWLEDLVNISRKTLSISDSQQLLTLSLLERVMGTILADITASDMPHDQKIHRLTYLYRLCDQLLGTIE